MLPIIASPRGYIRKSVNVEAMHSPRAKFLTSAQTDDTQSQRFISSRSNRSSCKDPAESICSFWEDFEREQVQTPPQHNLFQDMKHYAHEVLNQSSIVEFDSVCDVLLDESKDISPLLKHYD